MLAVCMPDRSVTVFDHQGKELLRGPDERISSPGTAKQAPVALAWHNQVLVIAWADETLTFVMFHTTGKLHYTKIVPPLKDREAATPVLLRWLRNHGSGAGERLLVANNRGDLDILAMMSNSTLEADWEPERVCPLTLHGAFVHIADLGRSRSQAPVAPAMSTHISQRGLLRATPADSVQAADVLIAHAADQMRAQRARLPCQPRVRGAHEESEWGYRSRALATTPSHCARRSAW
jgi:hypothetical protein